MEVSVISTVNVKPFSATTTDDVENFKPYKLSMLDQLSPSTYSPVIYFYPFKPNSTTSDSVPSKLKASLSKTLDLFYPLSGRVQANNNLFIHDFHQGVPFTEARIHGHRLADFLQPPKLEFLNNLLPFEPLCLHPRNGPQVAVQLNTFDCGGIALGVNFYHRIIDGATFSAFLKTWAANANPNPNQYLGEPDLVSGSSVFPPHESFPAEIQTFMDKLYFPDQGAGRQRATRRFVFKNDAVSALKSIARSDKVETPSRNETLSAFIWNSVMQATAASGSPNPLECFTQAVNMRSRMGQRLSSNSIGNLVAGPLVSCKSSNELLDDGIWKELVEKIRNGVAGTNENYLNAISGVDGDAFLAGFTSSGSSQTAALVYSSWTGFGFNDFEFGFGKPVWTGLLGHATGNHPTFKSSVILKEVGASGSENDDGLEAWIRLDEQVVAALERDLHFLKYASPNPPIIIN